MRNRLPLALTVLLAGTIGACSCSDDTGTTTRPAQAEVTPAALNFGEVCNESVSAPRQLTITNTGTSVLDGKLAVVNGDVEAFTVSPEKVSVPGNGTATVDVTYHPAGDEAPGARHIADVVLTWEPEAGKKETRTIAVDGVVSTAPVEPRIAFGCGLDDEGEALPACRDTTGLCCSVHPETGIFETLSLGETRIGATSRLPLQVENRGCGDLEITSVALANVTGTCEAEWLTLEGKGPATVPGGVAAGEGHEVFLSFSPQEVCVATGYVVFTTNDERNPVIETRFTANASEPQIRVTASNGTPVMNFGDSVVPPDAATDEVLIRNVGGTPVTIRKVEIENLNDNQLDFHIDKTEWADCETGERTQVDAAGFVLERQTPPAGRCKDELFVTIRYAPTLPADQDRARVVVDTAEGTYEVQLRGGLDPKLVTVPDLEVLFSGPRDACHSSAIEHLCTPENGCSWICERDADCPAGQACLAGTCAAEVACVTACGSTQKGVEIRNTGKADLVLGDIHLLSSANVPFEPNADGRLPFRIVEHDCDQPVKPDSSCTVTLEYNDANASNPREGYLYLPSNDPAHAENDFRLEVRGNGPEDKAPSGPVRSTPDSPHSRSWVQLDAREVTDTEGLDVTYQWFFRRAMAGVSEAGSKLPKGEIVRGNENDDCPADVGSEDATCFRYPSIATDAVLEFYTDVLDDNITYEFDLVATDTGACAAEAVIPVSVVVRSN